MDNTPREAAAALLTLQRGQQVTARFSTNNGIILLVWAAVFQLDMLVFNLGYLAHSVLGAVVGVVLINGAAVVWRIWYTRHLPIRPFRAITNRVIFWWSWYYVALIGSGVGLWAILIGPFPPLWLTLLGTAGALPLAVAGYRLRREARL